MQLKTQIIITTSIFYILLSSCATLNHIEAETVNYSLDLRKYSEKEFLFTPENYEGKYLTVGMVNISFYAGAVYEKNTESGMTEWFVKPVKIEEALDQIYEYCISLGADALMNLRITDEAKNYGGVTNPVTVQGIKISGLAIKRE